MPFGVEITIDLIIKVLRYSAIVGGVLLALGGVLGITGYDKNTTPFLQVPLSIRRQYSPTQGWRCNYYDGDVSDESGDHLDLSHGIRGTDRGG